MKVMFQLTGIDDIKLLSKGCVFDQIVKKASHEDFILKFGSLDLLPYIDKNSVLLNIKPTLNEFKYKLTSRLIVDYHDYLDLFNMEQRMKGIWDLDQMRKHQQIFYDSQADITNLYQSKKESTIY